MLLQILTGHLDNLDIVTLFKEKFMFSDAFADTRLDVVTCSRESFNVFRYFSQIQEMGTCADVGPCRPVVGHQAKRISRLR